MDEVEQLRECLRSAIKLLTCELEEMVVEWENLGERGLDFSDAWAKGRDEWLREAKELLSTQTQ